MNTVICGSKRITCQTVEFARELAYTLSLTKHIASALVGGVVLVTFIDGVIA